MWCPKLGPGRLVTPSCISGRTERMRRWTSTCCCYFALLSPLSDVAELKGKQSLLIAGVKCNMENGCWWWDDGRTSVISIKIKAALVNIFILTNFICFYQITITFPSAQLRRFSLSGSSSGHFIQKQIPELSHQQQASMYSHHTPTQKVAVIHLKEEPNLLLVSVWTVPSEEDFRVFGSVVHEQICSTNENQTGWLCKLCVL